MKIWYAIRDCGDGSGTVDWFHEEPIILMEEDEDYYQNEGQARSLTLPDDFDLFTLGVRFSDGPVPKATPPKLEDIIGMTLADAANLLTDLGLSFRVIERDGVPDKMPHNPKIIGLRLQGFIVRGFAQ